MKSERSIRQRSLAASHYLDDETFLALLVEDLNHFQRGVNAGMNQGDHLPLPRHSRELVDPMYRLGISLSINLKNVDVDHESACYRHPGGHPLQPAWLDTTRGGGCAPAGTLQGAV